MGSWTAGQAQHPAQDLLQHQPQAGYEAQACHRPLHQGRLFLRGARIRGGAGLLAEGAACPTAR
ncbi:unnamed protein product [Callosobruchus maculatus]|uniref:Uncharacterized protein n=1 Tax=Callosobruchus maculatus TaxID=64391 RepID=A0A653CRQ4_CALMS|nr:unnamed protein product [Callosobruchus maculatus]